MFGMSLELPNTHPREQEPFSLSEMTASYVPSPGFQTSSSESQAFILFAWDEVDSRGPNSTMSQHHKVYLMTHRIVLKSPAESWNSHPP